MRNLSEYPITTEEVLRTLESAMKTEEAKMAMGSIQPFIFRMLIDFVSNSEEFANFILAQNGEAEDSYTEYSESEAELYQIVNTAVRSTIASQYFHADMYCESPDVSASMIYGIYARAAISVLQKGTMIVRPPNRARFLRTTMSIYDELVTDSENFVKDLKKEEASSND